MVDKTLIEILKNRFLAIVEEMGFTILRTGHTVFIKETGDFGTALVTDSGEIFAAPLRIGMIRTIGMPMEDAIARMSSRRSDDVWIANDPLTTGGMSTHLPDVYLWKSVFSGGEFICYAWCFIHVSDIGGRVPGSIAPLSTEIYEEGLRIPPSRLYKEGELNQELLDIILANSRIPNQTWGDIQAALAALHRGERRISELADRYGTKEVRESANALLDYAEQRARQLLAEIPDGEYEFSDYLEGGSVTGRPLCIRVKMRVQGSMVELDFSDTDPQALTAFNIPTCGKPHHNYLVVALVNYLRTLDQDVPFNSGLVRPIICHTIAGSLLNPDEGAPVGVRAVTMHRVSDAVMGCLAQARPDVVPAAGAGGGTIVLLSAESSTGRKVSVVEPVTGGSGARSGLDGVNGCDIIGASARNIPVEVLENELPIRVQRYGLRTSSAGAGLFRGGLGTEFSFELLAPKGKVTARGMERRRFRPWGRDGGLPGEPGGVQFVLKDGEIRNEPELDVVEMARGDVLTFWAAGGGGLGDPLKRDVNAVWDDVRNGLITTDEAKSQYGVVLSERSVNSEKTGLLRKTLAKEKKHNGMVFDFGPERRSYECKWPPEIFLEIAPMLMSLPGSLRLHLREQILLRWMRYCENGEEIKLPEVVEEVLTQSGLS